MSVVDLAAFHATPVNPAPFDHVVVPGFVRAEALAALDRDFPRLLVPGSVPLGMAPHGPAFQALIDELNGEAVERAFESKFRVSLLGRPRMFTVRARCRAGDGKAHPDSAGKIVTVLIYLNPPWQAKGGRLRLLRSPDLADYAAEVPPEAGTLLAFRRSAASWHGHEPFEGPRRAIQMNWVRGGFYVWREQWRHRVGAFLKIGAAGQGRPA
ncbi:MAG: 2OG-Fe(II) oxygenase [Rhodospirillales bacterium]